MAWPNSTTQARFVQKKEKKKRNSPKQKIRIHRLSKSPKHCDTSPAFAKKGKSQLTLITMFTWYGVWYVVAMISRLLTIIGLFCKKALQKRLYSAKETYNFKEPTNGSHPISNILGAQDREARDSCSTAGPKVDHWVVTHVRGPSTQAWNAWICLNLQ